MADGDGSGLDNGLVQFLLIVGVPLVGIPLLILMFRGLANLQRHGKQQPETHQMLTTRERLNTWFATSLFGLFWLYLQIIATVISCVLYVIESYYPRDGVPPGLKIMEVILCSLFAIDYIARFYLDEDRLAFFFSPAALVDLVTVLPVFVDLIWDTQLALPTYLRPIRMLRALRILRAYRALDLAKNTVDRQIALVVGLFFSLIFLAAGVVQTYEEMTFDTALYFMVVTFSTVGYGDVRPHTTEGRTFVSAVIMFSALVVPYQTGRLIKIMSSRSKFSGSVKPQRRTKHVVVTGELSYESLADLISEFFNDSHYNRFLRCIILGNEEPSYEVANLLQHPMYERRVQFIQGSPMDEKDLRRVAISHAIGAFILTRKGDRHSDSSTYLRLLAIREFHPSLQMFVQLTGSDAVPHARTAGANHIVAEESLKLNVIAASCRAPGMCTLVTNLVRSYVPERNALTGLTSWIAEYLHGCSQEIYPAHVPESMNGQTFSALAARVFREHACVVIGVVDPVGILLNPGRIYRVSAGQRIFVIASDFKSSQAIAEGWVPTAGMHNKSASQHFRKPRSRTAPMTQDSRRVSLMPLTQAASGGAQGRQSIPKASSGITLEMESTTNLHGSVKQTAALQSSAPIAAMPEREAVLPPIGEANTPRLPIQDEPEGPVSTPVSPEPAVRAQSPGMVSASALSDDGELSTGLGRGDGDHANTATASGGFPGSFLRSRSAVSSRSRRSQSSCVFPRAPELLSDDDEANESDGDDGDAAAGFQGATRVRPSITTSASPGGMRRGTAVLDTPGIDPTTIHNHIVVCGSLNGLDVLINSLRQPLPWSMSDDPNNHFENDTLAYAPIVVLHPQKPSASLWRVIRSHLNIFYLRGSPLNRADLRLVGIERASKLVVLTQNAEKRGEKDSFLADADTILILRNVEANLRSGLDVVAEIVHRQNIRLVQAIRGSAAPAVGKPPTGVSGVAAGYVSNIQASSSTQSIVRTRLGRQTELTDGAGNKHLDFNFQPSFASGRVYTATLLDTLSAATFFNPELPKVVMMLIGEESKDSPLVQSVVTLIPLPATMVSTGRRRKMYSQIFDALAQQGAIALGLYRSTRAHSSPLPYVFTNPPPDTRVLPGDQVYVLARDPVVFNTGRPEGSV